MHFALLGDHPDGLDLARAAVSTGRHELFLYLGPAAGGEYLNRHGMSPRLLADMEELLADPKLDAVIVAGELPIGPASFAGRCNRKPTSCACIPPMRRRTLPARRR